MKFFLPDFCQRLNLNIYIIDLLKRHPEYFYDGIEIGAVYGAFPPAIWNGGRLNIGGALKRDIEETVSELNKRDIPIRYTYTNSLIEEKHLYDTYCNLTMEIANNGMNEVIVNSPILEDYLRNKYPNFKYITNYQNSKLLSTQIISPPPSQKHTPLPAIHPQFSMQPSP